MDRKQLQQLAETRIKEAQILLDNKCYEGAYYLAGYAMECAIKACIAKKTKKHDFPDKSYINQIHTHNLEQLVKLSGLDVSFYEYLKQDEEAKISWSLIVSWNESQRYSIKIKQNVAKNFVKAISDKKGIMLWFKAYW